MLATLGAPMVVVVVLLGIEHRKQEIERHRELATRYDRTRADSIAQDMIAAKKREALATLPDTESPIDALAEIQERAGDDHIDRGWVADTLRTYCHEHVADWTYLGRGLPVSRTQDSRHVAFVSGALRLPETPIATAVVFTDMRTEMLPPAAARSLLAAELAAMRAGQRRYHPAARAAFESLIE